MNLKEAKQRMKFYRGRIQEYKDERKYITEKINEAKRLITEIKGKIFRGEII